MAEKTALNQLAAASLYSLLLVLPCQTLAAEDSATDGCLAGHTAVQYCSSATDAATHASSRSQPIAAITARKRQPAHILLPPKRVVLQVHSIMHRALVMLQAAQGAWQTVPSRFARNGASTHSATLQLMLACCLHLPSLPHAAAVVASLCDLEEQRRSTSGKCICLLCHCCRPLLGLWAAAGGLSGEPARSAPRHSLASHLSASTKQATGRQAGRQSCLIT